MYEENKPTQHFWVQPGYTVIGTCSICGGAVTAPTAWSGVVPPVPTCSLCGAIKTQSYGPVIKKQSYGPVIDMVARKKSTHTFFSSRNYVNTSGDQVDNPSNTLGSNSIFPSDSN